MKNQKNMVVKEHEKSTYPPRTYYNARSAGTTLALAVDLNTAGEKLTAKMAGKNYIGFKIDNNTYIEDILPDLISKMQRDNSTTLNIAGNGIYTFNAYGYNQEQVNFFVFSLIKELQKSIKIDKIYTGGQTGVDIAGAIAGYALDIPIEITFPKGYMQKQKNGKTTFSTKEQIEQYIISGAMPLIKETKNDTVETTQTRKIKP